MSKNKLTLPVDLSNDEANTLSFLSSIKDSTVSWQDQDSEGKLSIDVAQTNEELIVLATMAGTPANNIELHLHNDLLTIRGSRYSPVPNGAEHFHQENYWGDFSRSVVLPVEVKYELAQAEYKQGVLIVKLPKKDINEEIPIMVVEE